jgi:hypothetical protein
MCSLTKFAIVVVIPISIVLDMTLLEHSDLSLDIEYGKTTDFFCYILPLFLFNCYFCRKSSYLAIVFKAQCNINHYFVSKTSNYLLQKEK